METNSNSETERETANESAPQGNVQENSQVQQNQFESHRMFIEYGRWKTGQHAISAIGRDAGDKRGSVYARIFIEKKDGKTSYIAKDAEGSEIEKSDKLWALKKGLRMQAEPLMKKAKLVKQTKEKVKEKIDEAGKSKPKDEVKEIGTTVLGEVRHFASQGVDIALGTDDRRSEVSHIRKHKQKNISKGRSY